MKSDPGRRGRARSVLLFWSCAAIVFALWLVLGHHLQARWARRHALIELKAGAVGNALEWLAWSHRRHPVDGQADVIRATCYRYRRQTGRFSEALESAKRNGASASLVEQESELASIQAGDISTDAGKRMVEMINAGAAVHDVYTAHVLGFLARNQRDRAGELLDQWAKDYPDDANMMFMRGVFWWSGGEREPAEKTFHATVAKAPKHELARTALAELLEEKGDLDGALDARIKLLSLCPANQAARYHLVRLLREMGFIADAKVIAAPLAAQLDTAPDALWELGEVALESGDFQKALDFFLESDAEQPYDRGSVFTSAVALALQRDTDTAQVLLKRAESTGIALLPTGRNDAASRVLEELNAVRTWIQKSSLLQSILAVDPNDHSIAAELTALSSTPPIVVARAVSLGQLSVSERPQTGAELFQFHCEACHGRDGKGDGRAARHLFPRPTNLRTGKYPVIATQNGCPALDDVRNTIKLGMPGTSMPSFEELGEEQITLVAEEVLRLLREGIRDRILDEFEHEDERLTDEEIQEMMDELGSPGEAIPRIEIGAPGPAAMARGREMYVQMECVDCHGEDANGISSSPQIDDEGRLTIARDLRHDPLKGGDEPQAIYSRLLLGMPGTPHPGCATLSEQDLGNLVLFCLSLRSNRIANQTNFERAIRATRGIIPATTVNPGGR